MIYKVIVEKTDDPSAFVEFGFDRFSDAISFMQSCAETADGFDEGKVIISIRKKEEQ